MITVHLQPNLALLVPARNGAGFATRWTAKWAQQATSSVGRRQEVRQHCMQHLLTLHGFLYWSCLRIQCFI